MRESDFLCAVERNRFSRQNLLLKLFHTDKSLAARRSFHLKMLTFLLFVTVIWIPVTSHGSGFKIKVSIIMLIKDSKICIILKILRCVVVLIRKVLSRHFCLPRPNSQRTFSNGGRQHLQKERGNFSYYEEMVKKLFEIFPTIPHLGKPPLHKCSTCAVVGNSFNLKGSNYGPLIDSKDIIIRMNAAPTKGYEEDVGTKTTHRVMYPESAVDLDNSTHLVLVPFKILDIEWLIGAFTTGFHGKSYAPIKPRIHANKDLVIVISPAFMKHVHQMWLNEKGRYPSTGFMTVVLSLHICDEINVFGYGADRFGKWSHYFETLKDKNFKTGQHPGRQEYKILQKLNFEKVVKLYRGTDMPPKSKNLISRMKLKTKPFIFLLAITFTGFLLTSHWLQLTHQSLCDCFSRDILPFIRRVEPFLSANNSISEDAFIWWTVSRHTFNKKRSVVWLFECWPNIQPMFHVSWQRLQDERRDFDYYKATVNKLFEIFPPNPTFGKWSTGRIRTCAVVGNSVNLKGSGYGRLIDMNDAIIRMNFAQIRSYEADVGTKTTHHVMYPESAVDLDNTTHLVLFPFKIQDMEWLIKARTTGFYGRKSYAPVKPKIQANNDLVKVISPAFMRYVHEVWLRKKMAYPSTGFMVLVAALHVCDQVSVFGFGADSDGNWSHYFEVLTNKRFKTGEHPGQEEYSVMQLLADQNSIKFYKVVH
ncbi:hypothetical protein CCH79_00008587 [Gambusia affinis]|uniref:ST3 beta-galactoside alpha-2,3-sialyltransferase 1 n=1 Tax=Gambusia affinis TaxID=33528 RepID=A0A315UUF0_GAMAF|nr:hypothetical protein CCH79_00008587 [Gambusia affinis]